MSSKVIDNYIKFIRRHNEHFKVFQKFKDVPKSSLKGWLYIFKAFCYDEDISNIFNILVDKFGKTILTLFERLDDYEEEVDPTNIECIHCTLPDQRERLIKGFLKYKTTNKPIIGQEYFSGCRNLIKILMLIMVHTPDNEIEMYEKYYGEKNFEKIEIFFSKVESVIEKIKKDDKFELHIEFNKEEESTEPKQYICEYCNKSYSSLSSLNYHQKTAKFCIEIQQRNNNDTNNKIKKCVCEYCNKEFTSKKLVNQHLETCKIKKQNESNKKYEIEIDKLKIMVEYKDQLIAKYEKEIEDYKKLLAKSVTTVNNNNNNNYRVQYNYFVKSTEVLSTDLLSNKIKGITKEQMDQFDLTCINDSISEILSTIFQDFMFCTDLARKIVAVKKEDQTIEKMTIHKFINTCLELSISDIRKFIDSLIDHITDKLGLDDDFILFNIKCDEIKEFISNNDLKIETTNNPLKQLPNKVITKCRLLNKN
jgi:hypothetical protein